MTLLLHSTDAATFEWRLDAHPDVIVLCLALAVGYWYAITRLRERISDAGRVPRKQVWLYSAGVATVYIAAATPIHDLSENYLLSAHMFQHLLLTLVAPPLFLAGIPSWFWQWLVRGPRAMRAARTLTYPVLAFGLFNALIVLTHLPRVMGLALEVHAFHFAVHAALMASALLMWWPVLSSVPQLPRISYPAQMAYLFLQSLLPAVIASFVTFADHAVYGFYGEAPRLWGISALADQQIAGGVMKILGSLIIWSFMGLAFFRWYEEEQRDSGEPRWQDVEHELEELGLTGSARKLPGR